MNEVTTGRIEKKFKFLKKEGRAAFVPFIMAADPTLDLSLDILKGLPAAGADIIELGVLFSDPMADGPSIQAAGLRAKSAGANLRQTLSMVREFRKVDDVTPIILMGYYNPIYIYGNEKFLIDAKNSGVDGLIVVDLPPEEDKELCLPALKKGLHFIRLATPTTDENRISTVHNNTTGFVYYVSIAGVTGSKSASSEEVHSAVKNIKKYTELPIAVGFGIKTPEQAAIVSRAADAAVVGSAIVKVIEDNIDETGTPSDNLVDTVLEFVSSLSKGVRESR